MIRHFLTFCMILMLMSLALTGTLASNLGEDSFFDTNGTSATSHAPTKIVDNTAFGSGGWVAHASYAGSSAVIQSNEAINNLAAGTSVLYWSVASPSANYDVTGTVHCVTHAAIFVVAVCGRVDTASDTYYEVRLQSDLTINALNLFMYKHVAGAQTQIGSYQGATATDGSSHTITLSMSGTSLVGKLDGVSRITVTDSAITAAGRFGFELYNTMSNTTGWHLDDIAAASTVTNATDFTFTGPSTVVKGGSGTFTITPTGGLFASTETINWSDGGIGGTFVPNPLSVLSTDTSKTVVWTPPSGYSGAFTLTATGTGALSATHTATGNVIVVTAVTNLNFVWGPGAWAGDGVSAMLSNNIAGGSTRAFANADFSEVKIAVTGATSCSIVVDTTRNSAQSAGAYPNLTIIRDGIVKTSSQLTAGQSTLALTVPDIGQHEYEIFFTSGGYSPDRWTNGVFGLDVLGFSTDGTFVAGTQTAKQRTKRMLVLGDSIAAFTGAGEPWSGWPYITAKALDADVGASGYGSTSWGGTAFGVPGLYTSYDHIDSAHVRDFTGIDYLLVAMGTNDTALTANNVQSWITSARTKTTAWIVMIVPPGNSTNSTDYGIVKTAITNAVSQYHSAVPSDSKVILVDATDVLHSLIPGPAGAGQYASYDNLHPNAIGHAIYGAMVAESVKRQTTVATSGGTKRKVQ